MGLLSSMVLRPSSFIILLAHAALIVLLSLTPCWYVMVTRIVQRVNSNSENVLSQFQSEIEYSAKLIRPMNSSSTNFARFLSSTLKATNISSFSDIETKVAPLLFQAFETVPHLTQISYTGMEGLFFSYYNDHDQAFAVYSNSSSSSASPWGASNSTVYYIQHVNCDNGELYGEATIYEPSTSSSWAREAVNSSHGYVSLGTKWNNVRDLLFISSARVTKTGVMSLGFPATSITDYFTRPIGPQGTSLYLATKHGEVLVEGIQHTRVVISNDTVSFQSVNANGDQISYDGTVSCKDGVVASVLNIQDIEYLIRCSPIDIMGIESVYVLAVPQSGLVRFALNIKKIGLTLFTMMMIMIFIAISSFLFINATFARREMHLCRSLIKQMEATQQAERRNVNESLAFESASHDVRASLAGLTGLIEMSFQEVVPGSELETNLKQMGSCTKDLLGLIFAASIFSSNKRLNFSTALSGLMHYLCFKLKELIHEPISENTEIIGLLNSILDTSKIEAGKMQLEEEELDVFQLLEDVVDLYHPVAMKKGVDLVLDPCNGSMLRYSRIKGDRGKLKQVLCNLLSNAVKFTDEGHIVVRAWAQKPSLQGSIIASNRSYNLRRHLSCLFYRKNEANDDIDNMNSIQQDTSCMDFVFEVDDTGIGIPKEKYKSVFENYVQIKEPALGHEGTGLGLGIVQSLVRLMHGDIGIMDKDIGEKGTRFRFNVLLTLCETMTSGTGEDHSGTSICSTSPKLPIPCPRYEASQVVLLIQDKERRRTTQRCMESLGIKVKVVKEWRHLSHTLKKIQQKGLHSNSPTSPGSSDLSFPCTSHDNNSIGRAKGVPLSPMDVTVTDIVEASPGFLLIVIDANAGPFSELCRMVSDFKKSLCNPCRVVWLEKPLMSGVNFKVLDKDVSVSNDIVLSKPFHGSRLFQVIRLLPEYSGAWRCNSNRAKRERRFEVSPTDEHKHTLVIRSPEQQKYRNSSGWKLTQQSFGAQSFDRSKARKCSIHEGEIQECGSSSNDKPLSGKKFLVVEDSVVLRKITRATLEQLGVSIEECENGEQAVQLVGEGPTRDFPNPPYDCILMDCRMPVMGGYEATRRIREMEKAYGVRIPIIALTGNTWDEAKMSIEAGMDDHLAKPIDKEKLEVIGNILKREKDVSFC